MSTTCAFLKRYKIIDRIGEGSFSQVVKCLDTKTGAYVAAKTLKKRYETWNEASELAELVTMQRIPAHPNLLSMLGVHYDIFMGTVTFIFDLMDMSLYDYMNKKKRCIPESRAKYYLYQVLSGLHHLYKFGVFHRDIKPENILMQIPAHMDIDIFSDDELYCEQIKIGDLGSVKPIRSLPPFTEYISTRWYRSPECLLTKGYYESKMDIWAVGCVFYEMLTTKPLFAGVNEVDQLLKIHQILGTPSNRTFMKFKRHKSCNWDKCPKIVGTGLTPLLSNLSMDGAHLMKIMITYDPEYRATIKQLLNHRYFYDLGRNNETIKTDKSNEMFSKSVTKVRQIASVTYKKMPQKRTNCNNRNNGNNIFKSLTDRNLFTSNDEKKVDSTKEMNYSQNRYGSTMNIADERKNGKQQIYENSNYSSRHKIAEDTSKIQYTKARKEFKSKTQEMMKTYNNKQNMLKSVTDTNIYKSQPGKFHDYHRTEIKRNIESTRHNFQNYNDIMQRIESKRNEIINDIPNRSLHDCKDVKKHYTTKQKYDNDIKNCGPMKRIVYSPSPKEQHNKRQHSDNYNYQYKSTGEQMEYEKIKANDQREMSTSSSTKTKTSPSKCNIDPRPRKRLEPIDEMIEPKRQKLFQIETSIRNLSNV